MKQAAAGEGSIAFTSETGTKPQFDEDLVEASVKIETLAGWARITRKVMNNVPGFMQFLNSRMVERLLKAEDAAILYGDGVSPNIKGILTAGNFTASTSTATILVEKIIDDMAKLEDTAEREANIIWLRPQHYYGFFKNKASGSGEYDLPQNVVITNGQLYISGVLAVPTTALLINTAPTPDTADYVVGDVNGAAFLVQESMRIEIFEQDGTNVRENKITVRIEETVALPVYGSDYFIKGTQDVVI
jgi:HK97 family phage major capsid protein